MLRFVYAHNRTPSDPERTAYLIGKDDVPRSGRVRISDGFLEIEHPTREAAALVVTYDAGERGTMRMQTCLLPGGTHKYLLPLELARHRIMTIIRKLEDWGLSDLEREHPIMRKFDEARAAFTEALTARDRGDNGERFSPASIEKADESLRLAIDAGEELALEAAARALNTTPTGAPSLPPVRIGLSVRPEQWSDELQRAVGHNCDFMVCPVRWRDIERDEGRHSYQATDRWIEWAVRKAKLPIVGGPIIELAPHGVPDWLGVWEHDYEQVREFAFDHVRRIVTRYRRTVGQWMALSGVNDNSAITLSVDQMIDLTRLTCMAIRKLQPKARVLIELGQPFGERLNQRHPGVPPRLFAELVVESGVRIDGLALRIQFSGDRADRPVRDLMALSALIDEYATLEKPLHINALGFPSAPTGSATDPPHSWWRDGSTPEAQAEWVTQAIAILKSKPCVRSVAWQAVADPAGAYGMPHGGLVYADGRAKPALERLASAREPANTQAAPSA